MESTMPHLVSISQLDMAIDSKGSTVSQMKTFIFISKTGQNFW